MAPWLCMLPYTNLWNNVSTSCYSKEPLTTSDKESLSHLDIRKAHNQGHASVHSDPKKWIPTSKWSSCGTSFTFRQIRVNLAAYADHAQRRDSWPVGGRKIRPNGGKRTSHVQCGRHYRFGFVDGLVPGLHFCRQCLPSRTLWHFSQEERRFRRGSRPSTS